jgi:1-deoxy-D-xylulose-5-phosphate synthase
LHGVKKGLKDIVAPQGMFEDLGLKYVGPVDGHDIEAVEHALRRAKAYRRPGHRACHHAQGQWLCACRARRGRPFHGVGVIDPETVSRSPRPARAGHRCSPTRWCD